MIEQIPFGSTGHDSTRILFGAAALSRMRQERADKVLELLLEFGINHIDVAASYGDAELRVGAWMGEHRQRFFLATKTGDRTREGAWDSIQHSLDRLQVQQIDLIQFHNLTDEEGWSTAMGKDGALEAAVQARDAGLVRFIGVTGHGTRVAEMHLKSLAEFDFDSVLLPYNPMMMRDPIYAEQFEALSRQCETRGIAMQTIKSIARRRWRDEDETPHYSWYEPLRDEETLTRAVHWVLSRPGIFLNSSSDATLLPAVLRAADRFDRSRTDDVTIAMEAACEEQEMEPLFIRGVSDTI